MANRRRDRLNEGFVQFGDSIRINPMWTVTACSDSIFRYEAGRMEERRMEAVKLFDKKDVPLDWDYDGDADTLYISFGKPKPALGVDVGEGVIIRYDEKAREVVGLTLIGVGKRMEEYIRKNP